MSAQIGNPKDDTAAQKAAEEDIWQVSSLSTFDGLVMKGYEIIKRKGKTGLYNVYRVSLSPVENPSSTLKIEVFKGEFDRIRAVKLKDPKANIKISIAGYTDKGRPIINYEGIRNIDTE